MFDKELFWSTLGVCVVDGITGRGCREGGIDGESGSKDFEIIRIHMEDG